MAKTTEEDVADRLQIYPMLQEASRILHARYGTNVAIGKAIGVDNAQVGRIFNSSLNPKHTDVMKILLGAGMSPNEAARMAGYKFPEAPLEAGQLTEEEQQLIDAFRHSMLTDDSKRDIIQSVTRLINNLAVTGVMSPMTTNGHNKHQEKQPATGS